MDLTSRLRSIVKSGPHRELTYEPDDGYRKPEVFDVEAIACALGGRRVSTQFGDCLVIDRRYESDRWHGGVQIGDCALEDFQPLKVLDPELADVGSNATKTVFIDLETTGLSGGAGTLAFLVGCGYFDLGAFQVRQFLLTSHSAERALLAAVAEFFGEADLIVTYNGKTFDLPVMETRWLFHRMDPPLEGVPHFDMLHPARRLWKKRALDIDSTCRLSTLERRLFDVRRRADVEGVEVPARFFRFVRSGDPRLLEAVLEHNRVDLVSLAAVTARAVRLAREGRDACQSHAEALALGKIFERAEQLGRAEVCFRHAAEAADVPVRAEALYHLGLRLRRDRRFLEAADAWRALVRLTERSSRREGTLGTLRQIAVEALAVHQEHRAKDLVGARELAVTALEESVGVRVEGARHRIARLDRKLASGRWAQMSMFDSAFT